MVEKEKKSRKGNSQSHRKNNIELNDKLEQELDDLIKVDY